MSRRTAEASKAIREAWEKERQLVLEGKATRDWTPDQQQSIIDRGKAYDSDGKAFEGHHMKSAEAFPEYQGEPDIIQFLTRPEHKAAHGDCFQNPTNGYYDPYTGITKIFEPDTYEPCPIIELSNPVVKIEIKSTSESEPYIDTTQEPRSTSTDSQQSATSDKLAPSLHPATKQEGATITTRNKVNRFILNKAITIRRKLKSAGSFVIHHPVETLAGIYTVVQGVAKISETLSGHSGNGESSNYKSPFSSPAEESSNADEEADENAEENAEENADENAAEENEERCKRSSPVKHTVRGHSQRYGKNKEWKEKAPFPRGGEKTDR